MWMAGLAAVSLVFAAQGENWPAWRGPLGNGISASTGLPVKWEGTNNVRWRVEVPEPGNSTPIVWGDRVFVTQPLA